MDQMDLPQVGLIRIALNSRSMLHRRPTMRIATNAQPFNQLDT
jgi:hypothetical protein